MSIDCPRDTKIGRAHTSVVGNDAAACGFSLDHLFFLIRGVLCDREVARDPAIQLTPIGTTMADTARSMSIDVLPLFKRMFRVNTYALARRRAVGLNFCTSGWLRKEQR